MSEIVTLAESLIPMIRELRHTTENDRRIAEPIVRAIRKSDLCRILLDTGAPPRYTPEEWLRVLETLAGAEAQVDCSRAPHDRPDRPWPRKVGSG